MGSWKREETSISPPTLEPCPGCAALLPPIQGPTHRYIGASAACWGIYTSLVGGGEPPMAPAPMNALLIDAYAAQHPGSPSPQAIRSVAVHLLTLHGVFVRGVALEKAMWLRVQGVSERNASKLGRFFWLTPPSFSGALSIADVARESTPASRATLAARYVECVWTTWSRMHGETVSAWFDEFIAPH